MILSETDKIGAKKMAFFKKVYMVYLDSRKIIGIHN